MAQFEVFKNTSPSTQALYPYLLEIQSNTLRHLQTTAVIPLTAAQDYSGKPLSHLHPSFKISDKNYIGMTPLIAGVDRRILGDKVTSLAHYRDAIVAALDFMIGGI